MSQELPCKDKARFQTKDQAEAAKVEAKWKYGSGRLKSYQCRHCSLYHIASAHDD